MRINGKTVTADGGKVLENNGTVSRQVILGLNADPSDWTERDMTAQETEEAISEADALRKAEIERLKDMLSDTDYKAVKYAEGWITEEEYAPVKAERQSVRERISLLERAMGQYA